MQKHCLSKLTEDHYIKLYMLWQPQHRYKHPNTAEGKMGNKIEIKEEKKVENKIKLLIRTLQDLFNNFGGNRSKQGQFCFKNDVAESAESMARRRHEFANTLVLCRLTIVTAFCNIGFLRQRNGYRLAST